MAKKRNDPPPQNSQSSSADQGGAAILCKNCGATFTPSDADHPRCPSCLRVHGLESEGGDAAKPAPAPAPRRSLGLALGIVVVGAAIGGYFFWKHQKANEPKRAAGPHAAKEDAPSATGAPAALLTALKAKGIPRDLAVAAVAETAAIVSKGKEILSGKAGAEAQGKALWALAESWLSSRGNRPAYEEALRLQLVRPPAKAYDELSQGAPGRVFGLELAALLLSLARAGGAHAAAIELSEGGGKIRAEATPQMANVGVALYDTAAQEGTPTVIDPSRGRVEKGLAGRRLADTELAAHFYAARAGYFFLRSEGTRANQESEQAMKLDERSPAIAATRAMVLVAFGQIETALTQLRRAVELGAGAARWQVLFCLGAIRAGQGEDAIGFCRKGVEKEPGAPGAHLALTYAYLAAGEVEKAKESAEQARKLDDADAEVHKGLAQVYASQGDSAKAKAALEQALRIDPKARGVHLLRGLMAMKELDFDGAVSSLQAEVQLDPDNERLRGLLASTLFRSGRNADAEKVLSELRSRSRDVTLTDQLIAEVRREAGEDDPVLGDGGLDDDLDGGLGAELAPAGSAPSMGLGGGAAVPGGDAVAPADADLGPDPKDDGPDEPVEEGDTLLPRPGEKGASPGFFKLKSGLGD